MAQTLERLQSTPESEKDFRLDLSKITVSEHLSADSPFELRTIAPTAEKPVAVYMAAPKLEDEDTMNGSFFAIKENREAFWQADTNPDAIRVVRSYVDGSLEPLGAGDDAPITGTFKVTRGEKVYMIPSHFTKTLEEQNLFNKEGLGIALNDEDLRKEIIEISIDNAISDVQSEVVATPAMVKESNYARRIRERNKKNQQTAVTEAPTPEEVAMSVETHQARAKRAAELVQKMNTLDPEAELKEATRQARMRRHSEQRQAASQASSEVVEEVGDINSTPHNRSAASQARKQINNTASSVPMEGVFDKHTSMAAKADVEQAERSYKVFDRRKWSRVEVLGQEIGVHGRIDFKKEQPAPEESIEVSKDEHQSAPEASAEAPKKDRAQSYEIVNNPNNDPAIIEQAINKLDSLRDAMADTISGRRGRLFSFATKKRNELTKAYNDQIITLGQFVNAESLVDDALTDSQKNLLVTKFVINEQMRLQAMTKEKLKDTKAAKLIEWMNIHNQSIDETLDARVIMQAVEQGDADVDKFTLARRSMSQLYEKRIANEQHEHRKKAARAAAIGTVGMAATVFGINPSMVGDAANNIFYGARKK